MLVQIENEKGEFYQVDTSEMDVILSGQLKPGKEYKIKTIEENDLVINEKYPSAIFYFDDF